MMARQDENQESSRWDRAYEDVEESRKSGNSPSSSDFEDLTKSSGSRD